MGRPTWDSGRATGRRAKWPPPAAAGPVRGDNYLGTADLQVDYWLSEHPTGQLPVLVAMVGFTVGGLYLLFAPVTGP